MPLLLSPTTKPADLGDRLAALRRRSRSAIALTGGFALATAAVVLLITEGVIDRWVDLPALLRAALLVSAILGGMGFFAARIWRTWTTSGSDLHLALRLEREFPQLNDALASTVQFGADDNAGSIALRAATRRRAMREAADCNFGSIVATRPAVWFAVALTAASVVAICLVGIAPDKSRLALVRLADPFGDHPWPPDTRMTVSAPEWLARGEPFILRGELANVVPDRAEFRFALEGAQPTVQALAVTRGDSDGSFGVRLETNRVSRTFRYQVQAGDAVTPWRTVPVLTPPELIDRDGKPSPRVTLSFPAYTDRQPIEMPPGRSSIDGVTGVRAVIRAASDRPLVRAWMELNSDAPARAAAALASLGATHSLGALASAADGLAIVTAAKATIHSEDREFELTFVPAVSGRYVLAFEDSTGLTGRREFEVRLMPDPPPLVHLERPSAGRESLSVLPDAKITLTAHVADELFAVRSVWLEYRTSVNGAWNRSPLAEHQAGSPKKQLVQVDQTFDLQSIRHPDNTPLRDGDLLTLVVAADDFDDVTTSKPPGRSHEVELRIVGAAALRAVVQKAQAEIQRELTALLKLQSQAREQSATADQERRRTGALRPEDAERLVQSQQTQQQIRQRIGSDAEGLRGALERLRETLRDNSLSDLTAERRRADGLAAELERLLRDEIEPIEPLLSAARSERGPVAAKERNRGPLPQAAQLQQEAERTLRDLSERMNSWSDAGELRAEAALIQRDQERLAREGESFESQPGVRGADISRLSPDQRRALSRLAERQAALAERAMELTERLNQKSAQQRAKASEAAAAANQPDKQDDQREAIDEAQKQADSLAKARDIAEQTPSLAAQMQKAQQSLEANRLGEAQSAQQKSSRTLDQVQAALAENPERDLDRLAKRLKEVEQAIAELADAQERLQKQSADAAGIADPGERREKLEKLSREQDELRKKADEMAQRLSRLQQNDAAGDIRRAARNMQQAREEIDQAQPAQRKQDDALDRLDDAQEQVEQERKQVEDQLQREERAKVLDALKGIAARQSALTVESDRVFEAARAEKLWSRALQKSLIDIGPAEQSLAAELRQFLDARFKESKVVVHMLGEAADAMTAVEPAIETVRAGPMDLDSWAEDRRTVHSPQQTATRRLAQLIDALQEQDKADPDQKDGKQPPPQKQQQQPESGASGSESPPDLFQLKLLRMLQSELNERTAAFAKEHPDSENWTQVDRAEVTALQKSQAELSALLESLSPKTQPAEPKK